MPVSVKTRVLSDSRDGQHEAVGSVAWTGSTLVTDSA